MKIMDYFLDYFGQSNKYVYEFFSPGRVNLIGEHIDYNGGYVFPAALSIGLHAAVRERDDDLVCIKSNEFDKKITIDTKEWIYYDKKHSWANFPMGVIKTLLKDGLPVKGCDIFIISDLPIGAGLSSSASLEVLLAYIFRYLDLKNTEEIDKKYISLLGKFVENDFIGVNSGIMDQFSITFGKKDNAILLNTKNLEFEYVPINLENYKLIIMNSNKNRELSSSKYNERRKECDEALKIIKEKKEISNLCEAEYTDLELIKDTILKKRATHAVSENLRVLKSIDLLKNNEIKEFGNLLTLSHKSLKEDYEVTGKELDDLIGSSLEFEGCIGARMTGAGFGGCGIAIVEKEKIAEFKEYVGKKYFEKTGINAEFYDTTISDGVRLIK
jgi:galactokinase